MRVASRCFGVGGGRYGALSGVHSGFCARGFYGVALDDCAEQPGEMSPGEQPECRLRNVWRGTARKRRASPCAAPGTLCMIAPRPEPNLGCARIVSDGRGARGRASSHWRRRVIGMQLGHYKIVSQLGRGGMASVYKAEQTWPGPARRPQDPPALAGLRRGHRPAVPARGAHRRQPPPRPHRHDLRRRRGRGHLLHRDALHRGREPRPDAAPRGAALAGRARSGCWSRSPRRSTSPTPARILHRDIKPANVMVEPGDVLTLTDFGIARAGEASHLTATRMVIGTPEYMSPEQARGDVVDKRSDLYALGVLMYEALGGRPPFSAASTPSLLYLHVHEPPPPLHQLRPDLPRAAERRRLEGAGEGPERPLPERARDGRGAAGGDRAAAVADRHGRSADLRDDLGDRARSELRAAAGGPRRHAAAVPAPDPAADPGRRRRRSGRRHRHRAASAWIRPRARTRPGR